MKKRKLLRSQKKNVNSIQKKIPGKHSEEIKRMLTSASISLRSNQPANVEGWCRRVLSLDPNNSDAYNLWGLSSASLGRTSLAMKLIERALIINPKSPVYNCNMGIILAQRGQSTTALNYFERALTADPDNVDVLYNLIELYEKTNQIKKMRKYLEHTLRLKPNSYSLKYQLAKLEYRTGNYNSSRNITSSLLLDEPQHDLTQKSYHLLAQACDRLEKYEEAYKAFERSNNLLAVSTLVSNQEAKRLSSLELICKLRNEPPLPIIKRHPNRTSDNTQLPPVFLVGFPRSGTTLTGQLLDSHSGICTLDEKDTLSRLVNDFFSLEKYSSLFELQSDTLNNFRNLYTTKIKDLVGDKMMKGKLIVDKTPLYICYLEMIQIFFPDAKVIVIHRDPRDVCISNFMQDFVPTPFMNNFLSLENTVNFYEETMGLYLHNKEQLSIPLIEVRYENLLDNMKNEVTRILSFLGREWEGGIENFHKKSRREHIRTPSYQQVVQPIYRSSLGRWKNYQKKLAPFLHRLEMFIDAFEYK